jgi:hypothetical protein
MKVPILSTFLVACLAFIFSGYIGYIASKSTVLRYEWSRSFDSLRPEERREFKELLQALQSFETSNALSQNTARLLQKNIDDLGVLRARAPQDVWPIIDLRIATDNAVIARLEEQANNPAEANTHMQIAAGLFRSLGWRDVSADALKNVADKQLQSRLRK